VQDDIVPRPSVSEKSPLLWKEIYCEAFSRDHLANPEMGPLVAFVGLLIGLGLLVNAALLFGLATGQPVHVNVEMGSTVVPAAVCVCLLRLALRSPSTLVRERERQTLESLLATDLSNREILRAKWWGCMGSAGFLGIFTGLMLVGALFSGGILIPGLLLLVLGTLAWAAFTVNLGMYCSLVCRSSMAATVCTMSILLVLTVGHWLLYVVGSVLLQLLGYPQSIEGLTIFHTCALTPWNNLGTLATLGGLTGQRSGEELMAALAGVLLYGELALLLWRRLRKRFGPVTGRLQ
jgi:hypothetical protein